MILKLAYTLFIGILLALFIGVGIAAFYPQPTSPDYPVSLKVPYDIQPDSTKSAEFERQQERYDRLSEQYQEQLELYNKNVSLLSLGFSVLYLILGLLLSKKLTIISDGVLLGSVLTLLYSIIRGFGANDDVFRFLVVAGGLAIALVLGYIKFVRPSQKVS